MDTQSIIENIINGRQLTSDEIRLITKSEVSTTINKDGDYRVDTPYSKTFISSMHQIDGANWDREAKKWIVPAESKNELDKALVKAYGMCESYAPVTVITIKLKKDITAESRTVGPWYSSFSSLDAMYHGRPLVHAYDRDSGACIKSSNVVALCDIKTMADTCGTHNNPKLCINKDAKFAIMEFSGLVKRDGLDKSDDTWEVLDTKEIQPIGESEEDRMYDELRQLVDDRNDLFVKFKEIKHQLEKMTDALHGKYGVEVTDNTEHVNYYDASHAFYAKQWRDKQKAKRQARREARKREKKQLRDFSVTIDDIEAVTNKAVLINLSDRQSFWYPIALLIDKGYYFNTSIPEDFDLTDDNDGKIDLKELHAKFGDEKKISKYAHDNNLGTNLTEFHHRPKHIEAKEVEVDDSLKR